jgi:hypothetical protein
MRPNVGSLRTYFASLLLVVSFVWFHVPLAAAEHAVQVGNMVYAGSKTSKCFSDHFLEEVRNRTPIATTAGFKSIRLDDPGELFTTPFAIMNGQGGFSLSARERELMKAWFESGGFLLASAGCSDAEWSRSMRRELVDTFGAVAIGEVATSHPLFHTLFDIDRVPLKSGRDARFEGVTVDGRLVCLFSAEGLNNTANVKGCCCCGGDEVKISAEVVSNALVYSLVE